MLVYVPCQRVAVEYITPFASCQDLKASGHENMLSGSRTGLSRCGLVGRLWAITSICMPVTK